MATVLDEPIRKKPPITPVGDVPAATARAASPSATALGTPPAATAPRALPAPPNFIGDAAGNVQANTPSAQWKTAPGAQRTFFPKTGPLGNAADRLASVPDLPTSPGAGPAPGMIDPPMAAGRGAVVAPSPTGGSTLSLAEPPAKPNLALEPQPLTSKMIEPPPQGATATAPVGEDISGDFAKRTAAARSGVDAGGTPRALTPGQSAAVNENLRAATAAPATPAAEAAPAASRAERAGAAVGRTARAAGNAAGRAARLGAAPVETAPARTRVGRALGLKQTTSPRAGSAALLATVALPSALQSMNRDTSDYYKRLGVEPGGDGLGGLAKDVGVRTAGVLSDFGAAIPDSLIGLANSTGLTDIRPFASYFADREADFKPHYATDAGGVAVRPSSLSATDQQANDQWETDQLKAQLAARTGQPAAGQPSSGTQLASAPGQSAGKAPVEFITPDTSGPIAPPDASGHQRTGAEAAMESTVPGTAVINGRVLSSKEISDAAGRLNTVPSEAFTNPAIGTLFSAANGGAAPTTEQAMALRERMGQSAAARLAGPAAEPVGTSGEGIGGHASLATQRTATINNLMSKIDTALQSGRRRTARELIAQLSAFGNASNDDANRNLAREQSGRGKTQTAAEQMLEAAQAARAGSEAQVAGISAEQAQQAAAIQKQLLAETDPGKRKTLQSNLLALSGKAPASSADKLMQLEVPVGTGLDARTLHLPYDPTTNQLRVPEGYAELLQRLQGSQPQAK